MKLKPLVVGMITYLPGFNIFFGKGTGGTNSARYCYSVWMRHLVMAKNNGLNTNLNVVAELGPGDSIGSGLAALLSGAEEYLAFDVAEYANIERNIEIFDELVLMFKNREDIPGEDEFPEVKPDLEDYTFPKHILTDERLEQATDDGRIRKIRHSILHPNHKDSLIKYTAPWFESNIVKKESVDIIFSQAVLEHVHDLKNAYHAMKLWLKKDGYISHQIDLRCHGTADEWNGHWTYSDFIWRLMRGRRQFWLNRELFSFHAKILEEECFEILCTKRIKTESMIMRAQLTGKYKDISDDDLTSSGLFFQAIKRQCA